MQRIQPLRERLQFLGPTHRELFLEQLLGSRNILDPRETVVLAEVAQSFLPGLCSDSTIPGHGCKRECRKETKPESAHASSRIPDRCGSGKSSGKAANASPSGPCRAGKWAPSPRWSRRTRPLRLCLSRWPQHGQSVHCGLPLCGAGCRPQDAILPHSSTSRQ